MKKKLILVLFFAALAAATQAQNQYLNIVNTANSGKRFVIPHNTAFNVLTTNSRTFTFRMMIPNGTSNNAASAYIFSKGSRTNTGATLGLTFGTSTTNDNTDLRVIDRGNTGVNYGNTDAPLRFANLNDGYWHHIALVYNDISDTGRRVQVYYDGVPLGYAFNSTRLKVGPIEITNSNDIVFGSIAGDNPISAAFDDIRIWDGSLNPTEVKKDAKATINAVTAPTTQGLLAAYDFEFKNLPTSNPITIPDITNKTNNGIFYSDKTGIVEGGTNTLMPDLDLTTPTSQQEIDIITAVRKFSDDFITWYPSSEDLLNAKKECEAFLDNPIVDLSKTDFLTVFARSLKFIPTSIPNVDETGSVEIIRLANLAVNKASQAICNGTTLQKQDALYRGYEYDKFAKPAILLGLMKTATNANPSKPSKLATTIVPAIENEFLSIKTKAFLVRSLYKTTRNYEHYWLSDPDYKSYQSQHDAIDTDIIANKSKIMMAFCLYQDTPQERHRHMLGFQRYMNRFLSYSPGTANGIKPDGSGFHHWTAFNSYMYAYSTAIDILECLQGTSFQVGVDNFKKLRDAVLVQSWQANDSQVQALSTCGRKPYERKTSIKNYSIKKLANLESSILTGDLVLAGFFNRVRINDTSWLQSEILGVDPAPFEEGFIQLNYSNSGIYRKQGATKNWVAVSKGFTNALWGTEIYDKENRYGRYQSYGALEIIYPENQEIDEIKKINTYYDVDTWNWNHNPGTTVIKLPWNKLHARCNQTDEHQTEKFAGSLTFNKKKKDYLSDTYGQYGIWGMKFQQAVSQRGTNCGTETHNTNFRFRKSNFFFDDIIVSLGSGITNTGAVAGEPTITNLFQRNNNNSKKVFVNGSQFSTNATISGTVNNWIVDNYGTGFYVFTDNSNTLSIINDSYKVPKHNQIWRGSVSTSNPSRNYFTGYIEHGINPTNKGYEYITKPNATSVDMQDLNTRITTGAKPYEVILKDNNAHILKYTRLPKIIYGYCAFESISGITQGEIKSISAPCLVMTDTGVTNKMTLSLSNPDLGLEYRSYAPSVSITIDVVLKGQWTIDSPNPSVVKVSSNPTETVLQFNTIDGNAYELSLTKAVSTSSIAITPSIVNLPNINDTTTLTATVSPTNATNNTVTWSSDDTSKVTVTTTGLIKAVGIGRATITAVSNDDTNITATAIINVGEKTYEAEGGVYNNGSIVSTNSTASQGKVVTNFTNESSFSKISNINSSGGATILTIHYSNGSSSDTSLTYYSYNASGNPVMERSVIFPPTGGSDIFRTVEINIILLDRSNNSIKFQKHRNDTSGNGLMIDKYSFRPGSISARIGEQKTDTTSSISDDASKQVVIFPNPAKSIINLSFTGFSASEYVDVSIFDFNGQLVFEGKSSNVNSMVINKQLADGVYVLKVADNQNTTLTKKLIIKN
jgi:uncharacterized protein YjdB